MKGELTWPDRLGRAIARPTGAILGLVDELLAASAQQGIQVAWRDGHCKVRTLIDESPDLIYAPLGKSVIRAVLARIAVLCNERNPNSVTPYGGQGEILVSPGSVLRVAFINTPGEQKLELVPNTSNEVANGSTAPGANSTSLRSLSASE
jgi:hypothetical protein